MELSVGSSIFLFIFVSHKRNKDMNTENVNSETKVVLFITATAKRALPTFKNALN